MLWAVGDGSPRTKQPPSHEDMCAGWKQVLGEQSDQGGLQGRGSELRLSGDLCTGAPSCVWGRHPLPCCFLFCLIKLCSATPGNPPVAMSSEQTGEGEGKREKKVWLPGEGKEPKPEGGRSRRDRAVGSANKVASVKSLWAHGRCSTHCVEGSSFPLIPGPRGGP